VSARDAGSDATFPDLLAGDGLGAEPVAASRELRAAVLGTIAGASRLSGFGPRLAALFDLARERAGELLREAAGPATSGWEVIPIPDVKLFHFAGGPRVAGADCGLVRLEPGARFPGHRHAGDEWVLVLAGEAEEEGTGQRWAPGDLVYRAPGSAHAYRVVSREPLVFAVVLHGGLELTGD
jgi:quercetin dioxygenase-like cupin family protein